jgi:CspA family cold shock protein
MFQGRVKWFNHEKGYGFLARDDGQPDIFFHVSAVKAAGLLSVNEGDRIQFDLGEERQGRKCAVRLKLMA